MSIKIYLRDDIDMGLGKATAQVAHALNKVYLDRFTATVSVSEVVLTPTIELASFLTTRSALPFELIRGDEAFVKAHAESNTAMIIDSGRTVFAEPTFTVSWDATELGPAVPEHHRLEFSVGDIPFKQPFFVNRATPNLTPDTVIIEAAKLSTNAILSRLDEMGNIHLKPNEPLLQYLMNGFGKTVTGCKKTVHFERSVEAVVNGEATSALTYEHAGTPAIAVFDPIASEDIEQYTRTKLTRLLDKL